jgi:hypothetical protein
MVCERRMTTARLDGTVVIRLVVTLVIGTLMFAIAGTGTQVVP